MGGFSTEADDNDSPPIAAAAATTGGGGGGGLGGGGGAGSGGTFISIAGGELVAATVGGGGGGGGGSSLGDSVSTVGHSGNGFVTISYEGPATATVPGAPRRRIGDAGNTQATVRFTPPASNGGQPDPRLHRDVRHEDQDGRGSPLVVTGLTNGTHGELHRAGRATRSGSVLRRRRRFRCKPATVPGAPRQRVGHAGQRARRR